MISESYKKQLVQLHNEVPLWGTTSKIWAPLVKSLYYGYNCKSLLDYGAGKGELAKNLPFSVISYDPAIPEFDIELVPADMIVCIDVLEHVENISITLTELWSKTNKIILLIVSTQAAKINLPDGRNAHINIMDNNTWLNLILSRFNIIYFQDNVGEFVFLGTPKRIEE